MRKMLIGCMSALALSVLVEDSEGMKEKRPVISHFTSPTLSGSQVPIFSPEAELEGAELQALFNREDSAPLSRKEANLLKHCIFQMERRLDKKIAEIPSGMTRVLLLGNTGSGKTTLLHSLAGVEFLGVRDKYAKTQMQCKPESVLFAMGSGMESVTFEPNIWLDKSCGVAYIDCPGFLDSSVSRRFVNAFAIDRALFSPGKVKILLVVSKADFDTAKGDLVRRSFEALERMIPQEEQRVNALGFVLTKGKREIATSVTFSQLEDMPNCPRTVSYFLTRNGKGGAFIHEDQLFAFPKAKAGEPYKFEDKNRLISFISQNPIEHLVHSPFIDERGQLLALQMGQEFIEDERIAISSLVDAIRDEGCLSKSLEAIREYLGVIQTLKGEATRGLSAFALACQSLLPASFKERNEELERLVRADDFVSKMLTLSPDLLRIHGDNTFSIAKIFNPSIDSVSQIFLMLEGILSDQVKLEQQVEEITRKYEGKVSKLKEKLEKQLITKEEFEQKLKDAENKGAKKLEEQIKKSEEADTKFRETEKDLRKQLKKMDKKLKRLSAKKTQDVGDLVGQLWSAIGRKIGGAITGVFTRFFGSSDSTHETDKSTSSKSSDSSSSSDSSDNGEAAS